jgi:glutathione S-transferase
MVTVWGRDNSINVQKVLWLCAELEIPFERVDAGGSFGKVDSPEYRNQNPNGLVPTLIDGGAVIWESNAILRYLGSRYGTKSTWWSPDPAERARSDKWMDWQLSSLWPDVRIIFLQLIRTPVASRNEVLVAQARERSVCALEVLDRELRDDAFVGGSSLTLGDIALGVVAHRWFAMPIDRPVLRNLERWYGQLRSRAPFRQHVMRPLS